MKSDRFLPVAVVLTVALALSASLSAAQGPAPQGGTQPQGVLGSAASTLLGPAFTYQGQLLQGGNPVNGTYSMAFSLYDAASGGNLVGGPLNENVDVTDGLFTVQLDFGAVFIGDARWLQIAVEGATLSPRQELTAAPYALSLRPGTDIVGSVDYDAVLYAKNTSANDAYGVFGRATATTGATYGVIGLSDSTAGTGVYGYASASSGDTYGVWGYVNSSAGVGVYGYNASTSSGIAIYGQGPNAVLGDSSTPGYAAVMGRNSATTGSGYGVYGRADSTGGTGVYGIGGSVGVSGQGTGSGCSGVFAYSPSDAGTSQALYALTDSTDGWAGWFSTLVGNGVHIRSASGKVGLEVVGGTKSAVVSTDDGSRLLYTEESTEVWFTDYGFGQLADGSATVVIDRLYAQTVNLDEPYLVFVTPQGDCGLYVTDKTATSFTVRALDGKTCSVAFDYRIVAKRLGFEDTRLEPAPWADDIRTLPPDLGAVEP